jgi:hypothetical protein
MTNDFDPGTTEDLPKTQLQSDRSGNGPPSRTAVGTSGSDPSNYRVGEDLRCEVLFERPGGYEVLILRDGSRGYLQSSKKRAVGTILIAQFSCWKDRN